MLANYVAAALRNLVRNKLYAAINLIGLAVGFAAAFMMGLFVRDDLSYDKWIPGHERTYIVTSILKSPDRAQSNVAAVPIEFAKWMQLDFPEIDKIARLMGGFTAVGRGEQESIESVLWADPDFFKIIRIPTIAGDIENALSQPNGIALSRSMAQKYFGRSDPIGETIQLRRQNPMVVRAVFENLPSNTQFQFEIVAAGVASFSQLSLADAQGTCEGCFRTQSVVYFNLIEGANLEQIQDRMDHLFRQRMPKTADNSLGLSYEFPLLPISDLHLGFGNGPSETNQDAIDVLRAVSAIGILILTIAIVNFINLATATASARAVEVGVRKTNGATKSNLLAQFAGEATIYVVLGACIAAGIAYVLMPAYRAFLDRTLDLKTLLDGGTILIVIASILAVGLLASVYPGLVLTRFSPQAVFRRTQQRGPIQQNLRQVLASFQFATLIFLLIATVIGTQQLRFAQDRALRFTTEQIMFFTAPCKDALRAELIKVPGVQAVSCASSSALNFSESNFGFTKPDGTVHRLAFAAVDPEFFSFLGFKPLAGRFFERERTGDFFDPNAPPSTVFPFILNESAVKQLGYTSPDEALGNIFNIDLDPTSFKQASSRREVIGIVPDFSTDVIRKPVLPMAYYVDMRAASFVNVKLAPGDPKPALDAIKDIWRRIGENRPFAARFMDEYIQTTFREVTRQSQLFGIFAIVALVIACLGLFGLAAFTAERRTKEIGIRKAMGASRADILILLLWQFTKPVLWANLIAWPAGYLLMKRWLESFAYRIELELWVFVAAGGVAGVIALVTVIGHALLVARARPVAALRYE